MRPRACSQADVTKTERRKTESLNCSIQKKKIRSLMRSFQMKTKNSLRRKILRMKTGTTTTPNWNCSIQSLNWMTQRMKIVKTKMMILRSLSLILRTSILRKKIVKMKTPS